MKTTINEKMMNEMADTEKMRQKQNALTLLPIQIAYILILVANLLLLGGTIILMLYKQAVIFVICYFTAFILLCVAIYLMLKGIKLVKQVLNVTQTGLMKV